MNFTQKVNNDARWFLKNINEALQFYSGEDVTITHRGSIQKSKVTMQRKGRYNGRYTANMLQFKIYSTELFEYKIIKNHSINN